jgi:transcriptional regulator with XRE-family HTH domain
MKIIKHNAMLFGNKIRQLREEKQILQRQFAAALEIDTPMYSKIERGERRAKREQVIALAKIFKDTLTKGIVLCPNLHRAFDRGLISISDDYTILINRNFVENQKSAFNISQFAGKQIFLPYAEELYPDLSNIAVHRKKHKF